MTAELAGVQEQASESYFGAGGSQPYEYALAAGAGVVELSDLVVAPPMTDAGRAEAPPVRPRSSELIDVGRFTGQATGADHTVLDRVQGPLLDLGCGPGRLVAAALARELPALGVDLSEEAIGLARTRSLPVVRRSIFEPLPGEGRWSAVTLLDGNVGIGGDPARLLRRCAELIGKDGHVVVETHRLRLRHRRFEAVLTDLTGRRSRPFPWAEVGRVVLPCYSAAAALSITEQWSCDGRDFSCLRMAGAH